MNGIVNLGNTCFLNSAIHALIPLYKDYFVSGKFMSKLCKYNKFIENLNHLILSIENDTKEWLPKHTQIIIKNFIKLMSGINEFNNFKRFRQADSYDFLLQLLDVLSMGLVYKIKVDIKINVDDKKLSIKDRERLKFYEFIKKSLHETSVISERIRGYYKTSLYCNFKDCKNKYDKFEEYFSLALPIDKSDNLLGCIKDYITPLQLDENNKWRCNKCNRKSKATKKMSILNTSDYIIICYKRYSTVKNRVIKNNKEVKTPFIIDISDYVEDNNKGKNKYSLCSIVYHTGNIRGGHYYNIRKVKDKWFVFNDSSVNEIRQNNIPMKNIYYMVYKRI